MGEQDVDHVDMDLSICMTFQSNQMVHLANVVFQIFAFRRILIASIFSPSTMSAWFANKSNRWTPMLATVF